MRPEHKNKLKKILEMWNEQKDTIEEIQEDCANSANVFDDILGADLDVVCGHFMDAITMVKDILETDNPSLGKE